MEEAVDQLLHFQLAVKPIELFKRMMACLHDSKTTIKTFRALTSRCRRDWTARNEEDDESEDNDSRDNESEDNESDDEKEAEGDIMTT